jgi:uncharacterized membrane protein
MSISTGIGLAFVAMLCWGVGDFLIQRSTRKIGNAETLFVITLFGAVVLLPFVYRDIPRVFGTFGTNFLILLACSITLLIAALFSFEALRVGKISIVEPIWSLEILTAGFLSFLLLGEEITAVQVALIVLLIVGLCLVSLRKHHQHLFRHFFLERGVFLALVAAISMGAANFLLGWGSRVTDPLMANFFLNVFITLAMGVYLLGTRNLRALVRDIRAHRALLLSMSITDNAAWVAFAFAMSMAPIAIATALSESYIVIAVLLGLFVSREHLQHHQKIGLVLALLAALVLAGTTS